VTAEDPLADGSGAIDDDESGAVDEDASGEDVSDLDDEDDSDIEDSEDDDSDDDDEADDTGNRAVGDVGANRGGRSSEPGNRMEDDDLLDDMAGNRVEGGTARGVLTYLTRAITAEPDAVVVEADDTSRGMRFRVHVAPDDMGRVIGRRGRIAQAIRTVVRVAGSRDGVETNVDFVDE